MLLLLGGFPAELDVNDPSFSFRGGGAKSGILRRLAERRQGVLRSPHRIGHPEQIFFQGLRPGRSVGPFVVIVSPGCKEVVDKRSVHRFVVFIEHTGKIPAEGVFLVDVFFDVFRVVDIQQGVEPARLHQGFVQLSGLKVSDSRHQVDHRTFEIFPRIGAQVVVDQQ